MIFDNDHLGNDHLGNDHLGNDHLDNDHLGNDRFCNDTFIVIDRPTTQPPDGHECSTGSYTSNISSSIFFCQPGNTMVVVVVGFAI